MARFISWLSFLSAVLMFSCSSGLLVSEPEGVKVFNCPTDVTINPAGKGAYVTWPTPTATRTHFPPFRVESLVVSYPNGRSERAVNGDWYPSFPQSDGPYTVTYAWCNEQCAICQFSFEVEAANIPDPCESSPCMNEGSCMISITGQEYYCYCSEQYTGRRCESEILPPGPVDPRIPCSSSPCQHGGVCVSYGNFAPFYICSCYDGYTGRNCQIPPPAVNPCLSNPCANGQCVTQSTDMQGVFTYTCNCNEGYTGLLCDTPVMIAGPCSSSPCLNEGRCVPQGSVFVCECTNEYRGILCEKFVGDPVLRCPLKQSSRFHANQTSPGSPGTTVVYPAAEITGGIATYDLVYSHPSGNFFPYGVTTVSVTALTTTGIYVASCDFDVCVDAEDGIIPLTPDQTRLVRHNYDTLMNNVPRTPEGVLDLSLPNWYSMDVIGELTNTQQQMIYEKYPDLFVNEAVARNTLDEDNLRTRRNLIGAGVNQICRVRFDATTHLVIIADTDAGGHAGFESQLVQVNNQIQWAFNAECETSSCQNVQSITALTQCQCYKTSRTVSALVFNLRASQQTGFQYMPVQFKQVYIYNCDGGV